MFFDSGRSVVVKEHGGTDTDFLGVSGSIWAVSPGAIRGLWDSTFGSSCPDAPEMYVSPCDVFDCAGFTGTQEALAYTPAGEGVSAANQKKICGAMPTAKICTRKDVAMFATTGERVEGGDEAMVWNHLQPVMLLRETCAACSVSCGAHAWRGVFQVFYGVHANVTLLSICSVFCHKHNSPTSRIGVLWEGSGINVTPH